MGVPENRQIVRAFYDAGNRGDFEACFDLIADDVTWTNVGSTSLSGTYRGKEELMEKLLGPLFGRLKAGIRSTIERLFGEADCVIALTAGTAETRDALRRLAAAGRTRHRPARTPTGPAYGHRAGLSGRHRR